MQKSNKKASILIWAIFISLILSITFISISTNINKNLKENYKLKDQFENKNKLENIINSGSINNSYTNQILNKSEKIIFDRNNFKDISLKKGEIINGKINENSSITITILDGFPVNFNNQIVENSRTFSLNTGNIFSIENLGGYSNISITSDSQINNLTKYTNYKIYKKIGNKEVIKTSGKIENF